MGVLREAIEFYGHPRVRAAHQTTIEITTDDHLTARGDCIVGIRASKGCSQIADELKSILSDSESLVRFEIEVGHEKFEFFARGASGLTFEDEHEIVIRKSDYVSPRTLAVQSNKAACDIPRSMVEMLKDSGTRGFLRIYTQE